VGGSNRCPAAEGLWRLQGEYKEHLLPIIDKPWHIDPGAGAGAAGGACRHCTLRSEPAGQVAGRTGGYRLQGNQSHHHDVNTCRNPSTFCTRPRRTAETGVMLASAR
jgi:hypothetical protein